MSMEPSKTAAHLWDWENVNAGPPRTAACKNCEVMLTPAVGRITTTARFSSDGGQTWTRDRPACAASAKGNWDSVERKLRDRLLTLSGRPILPCEKAALFAMIALARQRGWSCRDVSASLGTTLENEYQFFTGAMGCSLVNLARYAALLGAEVTVSLTAASPLPSEPQKDDENARR